MGYIPGGEREMKYNVEKMIAELCPTGVLYCEMGKLAQIGTGKSNGNEAEDNGEYPFFIRSPIVKRKNCYEYDEEAIIIPGEGGVGDIFHYINGKYALHQRVYRIHFTTKDVDTRFMYYYLSANFKVFIQRKAVNATVTSIRKPMIEQFPIPLPPLPIQQEIVRILDTFTNFTAELTDKLNAELTARRKQYEYYRDELLTFGEDVPKVSLSELARFTYGFTDKAKETGDTRFIRITDIDDNGNLRRSDAKYITLTEESRKYLLKKGDILLARTGATYGKTLYIPDDTPAVFASFLIKIELDNSRILNRYYWHFAKSTQYWTQAEKYVSKAGQQQFNSKAVGRVLVPIPPLGVQQKIVDILDKFDKLCADIGDGLPAEIEARQRQYEYYRGQLLKFDN